MADKSICLIHDCNNPVSNIRGWCQKHYTRWLRHGDPSFIKRREAGVAPICSIDTCGKPVKGLGLCNGHYLRLKRHGDPLGGGTPHGAVREWLDNVAVPYDGDECLAFPFSKDGHGYGRINLAGQFIGAHIYVAERCIGPKPSPEYEVCHSCGNGDEACVTSKHLTWGTRKDNVQDAIRDKTFSKPPRHTGERHPHCKFSNEEITIMLAAIAGGMKQSVVARKYGISACHLSSIRRGVSRQ